jgi:hypothetical protein
VQPWDADFQVYAMNTHSTFPSLRMTIHAATPGVRSVTYGMLYPEAVTLLGLSFLKKSRKLRAFLARWHIGQISPFN